MSDLQNIKNRFGIIGNYPALNRALEKAIQVAPTDISVLVIGESGTGKEFIPKIIHSESKRKHQPYIVVNCGAIPEGTIDSELFGHEKCAFTGATSTRKGYFEVADGGTIFLDEVGELPLQTQVRLLRVLESGEFMKVGSSQIQKTNVRIVAATNVNMMNAIQEGKFREDLYYRLNTVQVDMPPLRERKGDIHLLFRKFAIDFAEKYRMPELILTEDAVRYLEGYSFPGNVRQLRNLVEQMTVVEQSRTINAERLAEYIPADNRENMRIKLVWEYVKETEEKNSYSELIKRRHKYAHEGTYYPLEIIDYENYLNLMEYFICEFELLNYNIRDRMKIHKSLEIISKNMDRLKKDCKRNYLKELTRIIKEESKKLFKILENIRDKSIIFNKICNKLENLKKIDMRSSTSEIKKKLNDNIISFKDLNKE